MQKPKKVTSAPRHLRLPASCSYGHPLLFWAGASDGTEKKTVFPCEELQQGDQANPLLKLVTRAFQRLVHSISPNNHAFHLKLAFTPQKNYIDMHFILTDFEGAHPMASRGKRKLDGSVVLSEHHPRKIINIL